MGVSNEMKKISLSILLSLTIIMSVISGLFPTVVSYAQGGAQTRTVLLYGIGSNLETDGGSLTWNLKQSMNAEYDENLQYIVITGGADAWQTPGEFLKGADEISTQYNQVWKLEGKREGEEHGKMILLEETGIPGYETSSILDTDMLTAFLDYGYKNYPADKFDVIMWNHGGGPVYGFGYIPGNDDDFNLWELASAFKNSALVRDGKKFEIINFDACDMGNIEILTALCDYSEYFIVSPEDEPGYGNEYTTWLNAVKDNPNMSGFELGKTVVDSMIAYYEDNQPATLTVASSANFKQRLLPRLTELDDIFISEAKNPGTVNGRYNFYDEFYALSNTIAYAGGHSELHDLGNLIGAVSVPQSESNNIADSEIEESRNVYTDLALRILEVLFDRDGSDDDVIYASSTGISKTITEGYFRNENGEITWPDSVTGKVKISPTGLSIYFSGPTYVVSKDFVAQMIKTADIVDDPVAKSYLLKRAKVAAYYALIYETGYITSYLTDNNLTNITVDLIKESMENTEANRPFSELLSYLCDRLVSLGEFSGTAEINDYLSQIVAQQSSEVISPDKTSVKVIINADGTSDRYRVVLSDISAQALMAVNASSVIRYIYDEDENYVKFLQNVYGDASLDDLYPNGTFFNAQACTGVVDTYQFIDSWDVSAADFYRAIYSTDSVTWYVPKIKKDYFAVFDPEGNAYLADIQYVDLSKQSAYLPVSLIFNSEGDSYSDALYLYLVCEDGNWNVKGYVSNPEDTPDRLHTIEDYQFEYGLFALATPIRDAIYNYRLNVPISPFFALDTTKENLGLTFGTVGLDDAPHHESLGDFYYIEDVYDYRMDVTSRISEADTAAENGDVIYSIQLIDGIYMNPVIADGSAQTPALLLVHGDKELTESVDYKVLYDGSSEPGTAYALIIGIGNYADSFYMNYIIQCAEHSFEVKAQTDPTCTEDGERHLKCTVCGIETTEVLTATGHKPTRVPATAATANKQGNIEYWSCPDCEKYFLDKDATREIAKEKVVRGFTGYRHDPAQNAAAMMDIVKDKDAVYGFKPSENGSLKQYVEFDWWDPDAVESARQDRIAYHESIAEMYDMLSTMQSQGSTVEEIARAVSTKRNQLRMAAYANDPEGLAVAKARNLEKYGHEEGPLPDELYEKYGAWETVIEKAFSANIGMDACLGLYDKYYPLYVLLGQADPVSYSMTQSATVYRDEECGITFTSSADFADLLAVKVDGKIIDTSNYIAVAGSTKITLLPSYLKTLANGVHTVTIVSSDGEANADFSVLHTETSPETGNAGEPAIPVIILLSLITAAGALTVYGKRFSLMRQK